MTYIISIPEWTYNKTGRVSEARIYYGAELVDVLSANSVPNKKLIFKYYGIEAPPGAFKATLSDRLVFDTDGLGNYLIMPNVSRNKRYWKKDE